MGEGKEQEKELTAEEAELYASQIIPSWELFGDAPPGTGSAPSGAKPPPDTIIDPLPPVTPADAVPAPPVAAPAPPAPVAATPASTPPQAKSERPPIATGDVVALPVVSIGETTREATPLLMPEREKPPESIEIPVVESSMKAPAVHPLATTARSASDGDAEKPAEPASARVVVVHEPKVVLQGIATPVPPAPPEPQAEVREPEAGSEPPRTAPETEKSATDAPNTPDEAAAAQPSPTPVEAPKSQPGERAPISSRRVVAPAAGAPAKRVTTENDEIRLPVSSSSGMALKVALGVAAVASLVVAVKLLTGSPKSDSAPAETAAATQAAPPPAPSPQPSPATTPAATQAEPTATAAPTAEASAAASASASPEPPPVASAPPAAEPKAAPKATAEAAVPKSASKPPPAEKKQPPAEKKQPPAEKKQPPAGEQKAPPKKGSGVIMRETPF